MDILAKHCDDKSKLQQLKDKYKDKHDQVGSLLIYQYFLVFSEFITNVDYKFY